ncbi:MAG: protein kinase domain-containing protein [Myxococcota bacterium]
MSSEPGILPKPIPFGKYYLLERINVGGMAEVYKAKAFGVEGFERLLAVKKILASIAEDESFINMFIDEAKIAGQLNHPNIAQIFDLGKVDDSYFIAMEYISGKDLKTIFERARRIGEKVDIPRVCYIMMKVCEGLAHAHHKKDSQGRDLNIVHRDVSPQNILLSYEGEVKIIDFGIAKATGKTSQTQVGILKGKFSYMSPEQVRGLHVDHRSDIFSLGIVLYEMLTLERLFLGESDFDTLEKIRKVEMSPPSLYNPHIPKELEDIVLKALSKSPDDRFQSAYDFADAIEQFMRNQGYYFTNKDLAASMKDAFSADIEFENKKLEYYRGLNLQPIEQVDEDEEKPAEAGGLEWGEEEMETQIFDRPPEDEEEQIISESDIVYAEDVEGEGFGPEEGEAPTVEFDRWDAESQFEQIDQRQEPADLGPPAPAEEPSPGQRQRQPTAQVPAEPRRDSPGTVRASHPGQESSSNRRFLIAAIVAVLMVAIGLPIVYFMTRDDTAKVAFETDPANVQIYVDGKELHSGGTPITKQIEPGHTDIRIEKEGFKTFSQSLELEAGKTYSLKHSFERKGPEKGTLRVSLEPPDAKLLVDGEAVEGEPPYEVDELEFGSYSIKAEKDGFIAFEEDVELDSDSKDLQVALKPEKFELALRSEPSRVAFGVYEKGSDDRLERGYTPETLEELAGDKTYIVKFEKRGYEDLEQTYEPNSKLEQELEVELDREGDASEPVAARDPKPDRDPSSGSGSSGSSSGSSGSKTGSSGGSNTGSSGGSSGSSSDDSKTVAKKDPEPKKKDPPKQKPAGSGTLTIASKPSAKVMINGRDIGQWTPVRNYKVKAGRHEVELVNDKFNLKKTYYVTVKDGENKRILNIPKN